MKTTIEEQSVWLVVKWIVIAFLVVYLLDMKARIVKLEHAQTHEGNR